MLAFIDTESDPFTKELISIQVLYNNHATIYRLGSFEKAGAVFNDSNCSGIVMFNAPYDLGVLSTVPGNRYDWQRTYWELRVFENTYRVRRLSFVRNVIRPVGRDGKPVIDLLKLWSIFVSDTDISLKSLIKKEFGVTPIPYTPENAKTKEYQEQDIIYLEKLWRRFLEHVKRIDGLGNFSISDWAYICTPASITKRAYAAAYPKLSEWSKGNALEDRDGGLGGAIYSAYHGGITISLYRGRIKEAAWFDINGAYAHVIEYEHTDRYMSYRWEELPSTTKLRPERAPFLTKCVTDTVMDNNDNSLHIYKVRKPTEIWLWSYDILALRLLFDANITIKKVYKPIPLVTVKESLPAHWSRLRAAEEAAHGKTLLRAYYKMLSNTSYGIKAQREPFITKHTNLVIAGIITSRAHLILAQMVDVVRKMGCTWVYSDTDSVCVALNGVDPAHISEALNKRIAPYTCGCEYVGKTNILSLKRYFAYGSHTHPPKIRSHGVGCYNISPKSLWSAFSRKHQSCTPVHLRGLTANTERTLKRACTLSPLITNSHPFMFCDPVPTNIPFAAWFTKWYSHIDTKTTWPKEAKASDEFTRTLHLFNNKIQADLFFKKYIKPDKYDESLLTIAWDNALPFYE